MRAGDRGISDREPARRPILHHYTKRSLCEIMIGMQGITLRRLGLRVLPVSQDPSSRRPHFFRDGTAILTYTFSGSPSQCIWYSRGELNRKLWVFSFPPTR